MPGNYGTVRPGTSVFTPLPRWSGTEPSMVATAPLTQHILSPGSAVGSSTRGLWAAGQAHGRAVGPAVALEQVSEEVCCCCSVFLLSLYIRRMHTAGLQANLVRPVW